MHPIYLYGAGGHAKVVIDLLKSNHIDVPEIFDDNLDISTFMGIPVSHLASSVTVSDWVSIEEGTVVMQGAIIQ
jgi:hypothetical protein